MTNHSTVGTEEALAEDISNLLNFWILLPDFDASDFEFRAPMCKSSGLELRLNDNIGRERVE